MYTPADKILTNYAHVLLDFALGNKHKGVSENEVVYLQFDSPALPLALKLYQRILERGAHPMIKINDEAFSRIFYQKANNTQLTFFPKEYTKSLVDTIDHRIYIMADTDPLYLKDVDPQKIMKANASRLILKKWLFDKEDQGKLTWTLALYGTPGMAREAGVNLKEYWEQIIAACFLNEASPIATWRTVAHAIEQTKKKLNVLPIKQLHITARETDLWIGLGEKRQWVSGSGRNIPSFEIFTSPDWRQVEGYIHFDYPLYRYGNLIKDIRLEFKNGRVARASAQKNEKLLQELVAQKNADKIGEYSLTDKRFSRINKFMANTLYDENFGGEWGNTHLALGSSYHDAYTGDPKRMESKDWQALGYNESAEHTDIMATENRTVEAVLSNGVKKLLYRDGQFLV